MCEEQVIFGFVFVIFESIVRVKDLVLFGGRVCRRLFELEAIIQWKML